MANEMIGAGHTDCQVINGRWVVYVAAEAEAVRVTVRRDGRSRSAKVEILAPEGWVPTVLEAVRVEGSAESGHVGAVLTFPGGELVTIGAPAEALRASARCVDPAASASAREEPAREWWDTPLNRLFFGAPAARDGAREEPAPPPARWWQTVGAWGTREGRDTAGVVLAAPEGAWVRYPNGAQQWMTAAMLDGMTPIPAPPPGEERSALRASLASLEAERDSLRDALASLESTFRHWADSERNGAREAFKDPCLKDKEIRLRVGADAWTTAAEEVARVRKAAP